MIVQVGKHEIPDDDDYQSKREEGNWELACGCSGLTWSTLLWHLSGMSSEVTTLMR